MKTVTVDSSDDQFIISIDKSSIKKDVLLQFIDKLRLEALAEKVEFDEGIEELGEEIKADWWKSNKKRFIPDKRTIRKIIVGSNIIFSSLRGKSSKTRNKILTQ